MTMSPHELKALAGAVERIAGIDESIRWLRRDSEDRVGKDGAAIIEVYGRHRLRHFRASEAGEIALCAFINALLDLRERAVAETGGRVELPEPPCPRRIPPTQEDA